MYKLFLWLLPLCFFIACNGDDDMDDMGNVKNPVDITLSNWKVIEVKNGDNVNNPAAVYTLQLNSDGTFSIRLDVNNCSGTYEVDLNNKRISFDMVACTEACCDSEPALDVAEILGKVVRYELASSPADVPLIFWGEPNYINFTQN